MSDNPEKEENLVIPFPSVDTSNYVTVQLDCSFDELLEAFRNQGSNVERFVIDGDNQKIIRIAND